MASHLVGKQAVVVGAGMGGLTAVRALAEYFERLVVLERDTLPPDPAHRAGTSQSKHIHGLLAGGQRALSASCFPASNKTSLARERCRFVSPSTFASRCRATIPSRSAILAWPLIRCPAR